MVTVLTGRKAAKRYLRKRRRQCVVVLVERPAGWVPTGVDDIPPNVEIVKHKNALSMRMFASHYNSLELAEPTGRWALCKWMCK